MGTRGCDCTGTRLCRWPWQPMGGAGMEGAHSGGCWHVGPVQGGAPRSCGRLWAAA